MSDVPDVNDGSWHRHAGGPRPVQVHELSTVDGYWPTMTLTSEGSAISIDWADVRAYRVTTAHVEPPKPREWWIKNGCLVNLDGSLIRSGLGSETPDEAFRGIHVREVLE
jgi:hypothetical protein